MPPPLGALSGSVWDIPITVVGNDFGTIAENTKRLDAMKCAFPCMDIELHIKRKAVKEEARMIAEVTCAAGEIRESDDDIAPAEAEAA